MKPKSYTKVIDRNHKLSFIILSCCAAILLALVMTVLIAVAKHDTTSAGFLFILMSGSLVGIIAKIVRR